MSEEPALKRLKTGEELSKDDMLDGIFHSWDRDGSGEIEFDELLPHYMKSCNHQEDLEHQVRESFGKFMTSHGCTPSDGLGLPLFRKWLGKLDEEKVRKHYERHVLGKADGPYGMNINKAVDKAFEGKSLKEIVNSPVSAIEGLTEKHQETLSELGIKTIQDLGTWRFFLIARSIVALAEKEDTAHPPESRAMNIRNAMDRAHETKTLKQVLKLPPSAFNMFPAKADELLKALRISTIESLGSRKTFVWANAMVELEKYEAHIGS